MAALEARAADPQQRAMLHTYLTDAALPQGARVLEVGCGTGPVTRVLATWPGVTEAIGIDPSPAFVAKARELARTLTTIGFEEADGRFLPFAPSAFDAVVFHTTLCHVLDPGLTVPRRSASNFVHDAWLARRLPALVRAAGVDPVCVRGFGYVEALKPGFMLSSWIDLGANALVAAGRIGPEMASALKAEARRRVASGEYFGHIAYMSVVARKPI